MKLLIMEFIYNNGIIIKHIKKNYTKKIIIIKWEEAFCTKTL